MPVITLNKVLLILSLIFFLLATLVSGGVITAALPWLPYAGATALVAAFLV